jgi:homopolymeric O-antigen transport system ATP-binding protein
MRAIIKVERISKRFRIKPREAASVSYPTLRESMATAIRSTLRRQRGNGGRDDTFWALKDASFDVLPGEVMGVIGPNGAGKSTLLKVLSRIIEPTSGRVELYGRVASLLEVGTGFHPDLSGRENVYLNGAILGMKRREIDAKFDEIVGFAEVERFIDTAVKHYSSGMYLRLAFAVTAHLDPEVLIIDEVLAVGDASFQRKCLAKMDDVTRNGRTVLLVTHSLGLVTQHCQRAILLSGGRIIRSGNAQEVVGHYSEMGALPETEQSSASSATQDSHNAPVDY